MKKKSELFFFLFYFALADLNCMRVAMLPQQSLHIMSLLIFARRLALFSHFLQMYFRQ